MRLKHKLNIRIYYPLPFDSFTPNIHVLVKALPKYRNCVRHSLTLHTALQPFCIDNCKSLTFFNFITIPILQDYHLILFYKPINCK